MKFRDQVVIVTGAGKGIGRQIAFRYAEKGARVVVADVDVQAGESTVQHIRDKGCESIFVPVDVRVPDDVCRLMEQAVNAYGQVDILINNAGVSRFKPVFDLTVDEWDDVIHTNLRGVFLCAREAAKHMRNNRHGGSIVNIASTRALMSEPHSEAYAASKGGIVALTHALAVSLSEYRIRVNCISPGWIETGDYDALRQVDHEQHPAKRVGRPDDVVRACFYLTDPENDFVTGVNLIVDGGMTRKMIYVE
ncbi:MAG: 3-ketoacyl-ACP reductase [Bacillus thermozeamaize]|uniref:3-ketoacyl-ACP reductase n=1 Tax=Bacillus thermozeamaize TaxID=230954 RepID=A0A1Y3PFV0_9BACI|nr:MAG: 3-ketoacyl-ACP reductase [Bacillus thermozeamaize]